MNYISGLKLKTRNEKHYKCKIMHGLVDFELELAAYEVAVHEVVVLVLGVSFVVLVCLPHYPLWNETAQKRCVVFCTQGVKVFRFLKYLPIRGERFHFRRD